MPDTDGPKPGLLLLPHVGDVVRKDPRLDGPDALPRSRRPAPAARAGRRSGGARRVDVDGMLDDAGEDTATEHCGHRHPPEHGVGLVDRYEPVLGQPFAVEHVPGGGDGLEAGQVYPDVIDELIPAAWHHIERYANNPIEADHSQLEHRPKPMRGIRPDRTAQVIIGGHALAEPPPWPLRSRYRSTCRREKSRRSVHRTCRGSGVAGRERAPRSRTQQPRGLSGRSLRRLCSQLRTITQVSLRSQPG